MEKLITFFVSIYFWTILFILGLVASLVIICINLFSKYIHKIKDVDVICHKIACIMLGKTIMRCMPWWKIKVIDSHKLLKGQTVVYIGNDESLSDILVLFTLGINFKWMAKEELFKIFILGQAMQGCNYIAIKRGNKDSIKVALDQSLQTLKSSIPMMIFPEGTRSKTHILSPFKRGAFSLAQDAGVDIVPIVLSGTCDLVTKGSWKVGKANIKIKVLEKIEAPKTAQMEEIRQKAYDAMSSSLSTL